MSLPRVMKRDLFEAGLNEAAGSLAATYGRWSFVRCVERGGRDGRRGRGRGRGAWATLLRRFGARSSRSLDTRRRSLLGLWADIVVGGQQCASLPTRNGGSRACQHWLDAKTWLASLAS